MKRSNDQSEQLLLCKCLHVNIWTCLRVQDEYATEAGSVAEVNDCNATDLLGLLPVTYQANHHASICAKQQLPSA